LKSGRIDPAVVPVGPRNELAVVGITSLAYFGKVVATVGPGVIAAEVRLRSEVVMIDDLFILKIVLFVY
jgi:hypothetical protein